ncbi:MAG: hypothetical protein WCB86_05220 [Candidatus Dormiibacterota bacterium]
MSPGDVSASLTAVGDRRYPLLPFVAVWRRTEVVVALAVVVLAVTTGANYVESHRFESELVVLGAILLATYPLLRIGARRHYVAVNTDGLLVSGLLRSSIVPFEAIRQVRVQIVQMIFEVPSRRDRLDRSLRPYRLNSACLARLTWDPSQVGQLGAILGRGTVIDQDIILIVAQARELEQSLQERIRHRSPAPSRRR